MSMLIYIEKSRETQERTVDAIYRESKNMNEGERRNVEDYVDVFILNERDMRMASTRVIYKANT